ncbi:hypothetical protein PQR15_38135 [Streptomyces lydicus]|nr:hypothetical protein [Streptomyces lydicus]MDC7341245.1 hypothetical protein [Streptomyces lydicus]
MPDPPGVHELGEDPPTVGVRGGGHRPPRGDLLIAVQPGGVGVRLALQARLHTFTAVDRVQLMQQLYAAGLSSRTISELLPCVVTGEVTLELLDRLSAEQDPIDMKISDLVKTRDRLDGIITTATAVGDKGRPCPG